MTCGPPTGEEAHELTVVDVAGGGEDDVRAGVRAAMVGAQRPAADGLDHVRPTDHGPPEWMLAEHRLAGEVVDVILRVVLDHRDLLEDDLALAVDVDERRLEHHVGHHVERLLEPHVGDARVDDGRVARGRGVQLAAHRVEQLGDLLRVVARRALEQQVLDEVRDPCPCVRLVSRSRADPEPERDRPDAGQVLADDTLAAGERGQLVGVAHARDRTGGRRPRQVGPGVTHACPRPETSR